MPPDAPRVLIGGYYGFDNAGDEAILAALLDDLRALAPSLSAVVASGDPDATAAAHGVDTVRWNDVPALLRAAQGADLILLGGGGLFHDYWPFNAEAVLTRDAHGISYFSAFPLLGSLLGRPVAMYALGVGPLTTGAGRESTRAAFAPAGVITVRDAASKAELESLGIAGERVHVTADPAFGLRPAPPARAAEILAAAGARADGPRLGVALRQWDVGVDAPAWEETVARALDLVLEQTGAEVVFVPFQALSGALLDDVAVARRVRGRLRQPSRAVVVDAAPGPREKAAVLASCQAVLGMRLHSLIFAVAAGVPPVALDYDPKVRAAMAAAGIEGDTLALETLEAGALAAALRGALEADAARRARLAAAAALLAARAAESARLALGLLERPLPVASPALATARAIALQQTLRLDEAKAGVLDREAALQRAYHAHHAQAVAQESLEKALAATQAEVRSLVGQLQAIEQGWGGTMMRGVGAARLAVAPRGSRRERALQHGLAALRMLRRQGPGAVARRLAGGPPPLPAAPPAPPLPPPEPAPVARANAYDVVCFPIIDWDFRFQRPQQLLTRFAAAGHRVFYVATGFRAEGPPCTLRPLAPNVYEVSLRGPARNLYADVLEGAELERIFTALDALRRDCGLGATVSIVDLPFWWPLARLARKRLAWPVVYDCMDHHAGFREVEPAMLAQEGELLAGADLVCASSQILFESCREKNANTLLLPNACDYEHFAAVPPPVPKARPVVGYYGAIGPWFDSDLMADLALRRPDWDFVLVGSTYQADLARLGQLPNVTLAGEQPYDSLPGWIAGFDVLVLPFKRVPLTEATNPVKLYEILAAGRPLVAVPLPEVRVHEGLVSLASTAEEFDRAIASLLEPSAARAGEARAFARGQTWAARHEALAPRVRDAFPPLSIVVVTYNNADLNRQCLDSIYERTEWPHFEVIVVDNASADETPAVVAEASSRHPHLSAILNPTNRGFAAANNQGLERARGRHLILLNNDTIVTRGWASALVRHLVADPGLGLVGPVTNAIGNEAKVEVGYAGPADLPGWAARYVREHDGELFEIPMLAMFCVALRRDVLAAVGPLDERFGVGMFEDDDYNARVRERGLRVLCARDSFVHHWQRASFRLMSDAEYLRLFEENRRKYEAKWGRPWKRPEPPAAPSPAAAAAPAPPAPATATATLPGLCTVCGSQTTFQDGDPRVYRETLPCAVCRATSRYRSIARGLLRAARDLAGVDVPSVAALRAARPPRRLAVYDTQLPFAYDTAAYPIPTLLAGCAWIDLQLSGHDPSRPWGGTLGPGISNQTLEALTFPDASFDVVITSDVMEHVRLDGRAHGEIARVLKPGGAYLFTVPHWRTKPTLVRVATPDPDDPSRDEHLLPPEYHGDANASGGRALSYRVYGPELDATLESLGFSVDYTRDDRPELGIFGTELFYCRKRP